MALRIEIEERGKDLFLVRLDGRLDTNTASDCERRLAPLLETARQIVLHLEELEYISSMGLRVLLSARKAMAAHRGRLVLASPSPAVQKVLDLAEILPATDIFQSLESADIFLDAVQHKEKYKDIDVDA